MSSLDIFMTGNVISQLDGVKISMRRKVFRYSFLCALLFVFVTAVFMFTACGKEETVKENRHHRFHRLRQIHPAEPHPPLLRCDQRQSDRGRDRRPRHAAGDAAQPAGLCSSKGHFVQRQHCITTPTTKNSTNSA